MDGSFEEIKNVHKDIMNYIEIRRINRHCYIKIIYDEILLSAVINREVEERNRRRKPLELWMKKFQRDITMVRESNQ